MPSNGNYDAIVAAVVYREFTALGATVLFDVKGVFAKEESDGRL